MEGHFFPVGETKGPDAKPHTIFPWNETEEGTSCSPPLAGLISMLDDI
jgi:hypothetical protein